MSVVIAVLVFMSIDENRRLTEALDHWRTYTDMQIDMSVRNALHSEVGHCFDGKSKDAVIHRYEVNMNLLKAPDVKTIYGSAFVSGCTQSDLNTVRDWLAENIEKGCPDAHVIKEDSIESGVSAGIGVEVGR